MNQEIITLGIDISKKTFDVALYFNPKYKHKKFKNNPAGFKDLLNWLDKQAVNSIHACMEATGIYGEALSEFLYDNSYTVSIVNPARIKAFGQSELSRSKTDKVDSGLIAKFCALLQPEHWQPQPPEIRKLRDLSRRLEALKQMRQQELNRLEASSDSTMDSLNDHVKYLTQEIKRLEENIKTHIDQNPDLKHKKTLLESIPGIGTVTINLILSEFGQVTQFKNAKALAAYVGVTPKIRQSGTSLNGRSSISKMGRSALRKAFFMPAMVALRYNPIFIKMKNRLTLAGKPKMVIIGAAMRKLIHIIYGVLKNNCPFDANYA